jgi:two-component system, NtrC family, sensor kinase
VDPPVTAPTHLQPESAPSNPEYPEVRMNHRSVEAALIERVKELTCLHGIARAAAKSEVDLPSVLREIVALLPPAWQYPEAAQARIVLDGAAYATDVRMQVSASQSAPLAVRGAERGRVEVAYVEAKPPADEGPFLREERALIVSVAREVSTLVERRMIEEERVRLQDQLRHADRLATIGQLAAGVVHELNEPLASILGFAQLCRKHQGLPAPALADMDKIVGATLHAREVVKKLMLFARERPAIQERVEPADVIEEGIAFVEARARKVGIQILRRVEPALPALFGDPNQLIQVIVNLAVNAIQAMPRGGRLTVGAFAEGDAIALVVEDEGDGMPPAVLERVFDPFFTTKGVGEGTGLGLAVVHGIIAAHGGTIRAQSQVGKGSRFEALLPVAAPRGADPEGSR